MFLDEASQLIDSKKEGIRSRIIGKSRLHWFGVNVSFFVTTKYGAITRQNRIIATQVYSGETVRGGDHFLVDFFTRPNSGD